MTISALHVRMALTRRWEDAARRQSHSAKIAFRIGEIRGGGDVWVAESHTSHDGGPWRLTVTVLEFCEGRLRRETVYAGGARRTCSTVSRHQIESALRLCPSAGTFSAIPTPVP